MALFGTSGIRGRFPEEVSPGLFLRVGAALATLLEEAAVARDVRHSGPSLQAALMAGLTSRGVRVHDAGVLPTPTLAHLATRFDGGGIVTASHNPPDYNGLKLWTSQGMAFDAAWQARLEGAMEGDPPHAGWREVGQVLPYTGALREHRERILAAVDPSEARVAVDCGNGPTGSATPFVLREQGCDVRTLHAQPDGAFPGRGAEPTEEALAGLRRMVVRGGCALGIAHDGDGDRMVAVDEAGRVVPAEKLLLLFARRGGARKVVAPVDASMVLEDTLGTDAVVRTRVGDVFVAEALQREAGDLGGEPSGTWIFPDFALCPDGVYAAAHLASLLQGEALGDLVGEFPSYPVLRGSLPFAAGEEAEEALEAAVAALDAERVTRLDGWRLAFEDGWALVRPSGTEPLLRLTAEAREEARAREIYAALHGALSRAIA